MDTQIHNELCWYLNEWLGIWNDKFLSNWDFLDDKPIIPSGNEPSYETAKINSETLSELLALDVIESGL